MRINGVVESLGKGTSSMNHRPAVKISSDGWACSKRWAVERKWE